MDSISVEQWLDELAAKQPTPGGGGVAALAAALSAGLLGMVSIYTTGEKWAERSERMQRISDVAADLRTEALGLVQADAEAFAKVGAAYGMPKITASEKAARQKAIQDALIAAAEPPTLVVGVAAQLVELAEELAPNGNPAVISDVAVAASQARAALEAAIVNIEINAILITSSALQQGLAQMVQKAAALLPRTDAVVATVRQRMAD